MMTPLTIRWGRAGDNFSLATTPQVSNLKFVEKLGGEDQEEVTGF